MRTLLALALGVGLAVVTALILGEYPFTGPTPYLAAVLLPAVIGAAVVWTGRDHAERLWAATAVLSAAAMGWAVWISTGRGLDPVPAGAWIAISAALVWPLAWAGLLAHRRRPRRTRPFRDSALRRRLPISGSRPRRSSPTGWGPDS